MEFLSLTIFLIPKLTLVFLPLILKKHYSVFSVSGVDFTGTVKIMLSERGYRFYDITGIKKVTHESDLSSKVLDVAMDNSNYYNTTNSEKSNIQKVENSSVLNQKAEGKGIYKRKKETLLRR